MKRMNITVGSRTTVGGVVVTGWELMTINDQILAREGDSIECPVCGSTGVIVLCGPRHDESLGGRQAALEGDLCQCLCRPAPRLIPDQYIRGQVLGDARGPQQSYMEYLAQWPESPAPKKTAPASANPELEEEDEEEELESGITLHVGLFFDGTGNNQGNSEAAKGCLAISLGIGQKEGEDIRQHCASFGFDGKGNSPDNSYSNDVTNVARLYDLYPDHADTQLPQGAEEAFLSVYLEGIGTVTGQADSVYGQASGQGSTGIVARVEQAPALILEQIRRLQDNNPGLIIWRIVFDLFGFSRGAAAARHCANDLVKGADSLLAKALPAGSPLLVASFKWRHRTDFNLNFIGLFDTVPGVVAPLSGDFSPHNASNPGLDLYLAPGIARHVVQFVARHEYRHNFSLVRTDNDIELPGVHSDLGGGYLPLATEKVLLSRPQSSQVPVDMPETSTVAYDRARQLMGVMLPDLEPYLQRWSIDTWAVVLPYNKRRDMFAEKRVYASLRSERQVHGQLSLIYLRAMRELGIRNGVPFDVVPDTSAFALPADLHTIAVKLQAYAVGDSFPGLTHEEVALLQRKYIHLSGNWNAASGKNNSDIEVLFINRPAAGGKRAVHPNE
ncbi:MULTISPECIES: phospholipase effector Tle1 domain-containing protein [unclassified Pseudomonas]|uniref:phospholipase effector Tle1 domain-containing protein n=1 Tax=unclassified Pseudomonas TaxID=196821 RepID=UPI001294F536|nr:MULTISPECIES: DUF2235 domain-containing protein [unclassified Pseudomonas]MQT40484.1 type IV secretion protein Rhs [Pseudomonas sp. FSL R10-0765]MQT52180.1 type IV secretion protein Rhs [Pseudomonas sp. FSL R10-2398]MQU01273.1 type IV secretion protein Rhs [Pseudomonas sp. FSL R10-2245]MQU11816.1 type IV secretion protein Rhs [Pseudomonas sp. FSL R10-2189]MQU37975.1 type IV secretion protein Rhs [Pseudomonas sp. FSL R10-2172]